MGENNFVADYIRANPEILKHTEALKNAVWAVKAECFNVFWANVAQCLKSHGIDLDLSNMKFVDSSYKEALVKRHGSPFEVSGELNKVSVFYEPRIDPPIYITIKMSSERKNLSPQLKSNVEIFEEKLREADFGKVNGNVGQWWCATVPLPCIKFNNDSELCEILEQKDGSNISNRASKTAEKIVKYIETTETLWCEIQRR